MPQTRTSTPSPGSSAIHAADDAVPVDWAAVESWLGTGLPADYKAVAAAYGPLDIGAWLWLHMPCVNRGWFDYGAWVQQARRDAHGVLPFGATRTADTLYWDTTASDDPDQWPVVMHCQDDENAGRDPWRRFTTPLVPTLARLVADGMRPVASRSGIQSDLERTPWTPPPRRPEPTARQRAALTTGCGLDALIALVPPPETPVLGKHNWDWLHERLGTRLPGDYVRLMERYGPAPGAAGCVSTSPSARASTRSRRGPSGTRRRTRGSARSSLSTILWRSIPSPGDSCPSPIPSTATNCAG